MTKDEEREALTLCRQIEGKLDEALTDLREIREACERIDTLVKTIALSRSSSR